jgi:rare lipoprotein A
VTNLDNGNQVVVRINDRGPFHSTRIIDVSYTAALKLGLLDKGSHMLEVVRILPAEAGQLAASNKGGSKPATVLRPQAPAPQREPAQVAALLYPAPPAPAPAAAGTAVQPAPAEAAQPAVVAVPAVAAPAVTPAATPAGGVMLAGGAHAPAGGAIVPAVATVAARGGFYLQLGAYGKPENAEAARAKVAMESGLEGLEVVPSGSVLRLYGGPFTTRQEAEKAMQALPASLGLKPLVIQR